MKSKSQFFKKLFSFFFMFSTLMEPFAQAADYPIDVSEARVREFVKETNLDNSKQTMGQFFSKIEKTIPARVANQMRPWFETHSHEKMPALDVSKFKDTDGKQKIRLTLTKGKESISISFLGEDERMAKVGSVSLMLEDVLKFAPMVDRIYAHIPSTRELKEPASEKKAPEVPQIVVRPKDEYTGFFAFPTAATFKKMTPAQRAELVVRLRQVWNASQEVRMQMLRYQALPEKRNRKTSEYQHEIFHDYFFSALFGSVAVAGSAVYFSKEEGKGCIDSGWLGEWTGTSCTSTEKDRYKQLVERAKGAPNCAASFCNPAIYGFDASGNPICTVKKAIRQNATHWEGVCDSGSRLASQKVVADLDINPNSLNSDDGNQNKIRDEILKQDGAAVKSETERMLKSMLKKGLSTTSDGDVGPIDSAKVDALFSGAADAGSIDAFEKVVKGFYDDITSSLNACSKMEFPDKLLTSKKVNESNDRTQQLNACRQLWRRKLAFDAGMSQICPAVHKGKGVFEIPSLTCRKLEPEPRPPVTCDAVTQDTVKQNKDGKEVITCKCKAEFPVDKGAKCEKKETEKTNPPPKDEKKKNCNRNVISDFNRATCLCNDGSEPVERDGALRCGKKEETKKDAKDKCKDPSFSQWFSCNSDWLVPVTSLVVIGGTYAIIRRDANKNRQNATDLCPGTTQVCPGGVNPNICTSPLIYNYSTGTCYLSCAPGTTANYTLSPPQCLTSTTVPTCSAIVVGNCLCNGTVIASYTACTTTTTYTCPDGSVVANSSLCTNVYTCPNGLKVANASQCPVNIQKTSSEGVQGTIRKIDPGQK